MARLVDPAPPAAAQLRRMLNGLHIAQVLHVAARLALSDHLDERPQTVAELAAATSTHPRTLGRLLHALETLGLYEQDAEGRFRNTELGGALQSGSPGGVAGWARLIGREHYWNTWSSLVDSVRTGDNAFTALHGISVWSWRQRHPEEQAVFDEAMTGMTIAVVEGAVAAYDFSVFTTVADIGGGHGSLLASVLAKNPHVRGVLLDQPAVVAGAASAFAAAGVADRCTVVAGDFFASVPVTADAYVLKSVIHDWDDEEAVAILRRCRDAAPDGATLLLVEQLLDRAPDPVRTALSDLNMLVMPGGRERTSDEYAALAAAAGWTMTRIVPTATDFFLLEATAG